MTKRYRILVLIASAIITLSPILASAQSLTMDSQFAIQVSPSFDIPLVEAFPEVTYTEASSGINPANVCVYRAEIPIVGKFTFPDSDNPSFSMHWVTGSFAFNVTFNITKGKTGQSNISYKPTVSDTLVTAYNAYTAGLNSNVCRIVGFFGNYSTYGQPYCNLGTFIYEQVIVLDSNLTPESYITVQPTLTKITSAVFYPDSPDASFGITGQIQEALNTNTNINDICSVLHAIYTQDAVMFANILSYIDQVETNQSTIIGLLTAMKAQDLSFYNEVREYLSAKQEEASEAVQEATRVQQEASEMASELAQTKPDLSLAMEQVERIGEIQGQQGKELFFWLTGPILAILIMAIVVGTISYILFGKKR